MDRKELIQNTGEIADIINTEAIGIKDHYFLATHMPFRNLKYSFSGRMENEGSTYDENELFDKILCKGLDRHKLFVVHGDSGIGKSHFIKWIKFKFDMFIESNEYKIVFITRREGTLKSSIIQILEQNIFDNTEMTNKYRNLIETRSIFENEDLKKLIIYQYAYCIDADSDSEILSKIEKERLRAFILNKDVMEKLLLVKGKFIDRLDKKLRSDSLINSENLELQIRIDDLDVDVDLMSSVQNSGNRDAKKMGDMLLQNRDKIKEKTVRYMNDIIDKVIQATLKIGANDVRELFKDIRKELRKENKNLILLIEDITSLVGIDKALFEALIDQGNAGTDELCNLVSFIGLTNDYYRFSISDNVKDRVTARIVIDKDSIFSDDNDIISFIGKYINAFNIGEEKLIEWYGMGAIHENLPIMDESEYPSWSKKNYGDKTIVFYPFNEQAIINLYESMDIKTPRYFLKDVFRHIYGYSKAHDGNLIDTRTLKQCEINIPGWEDQFMGIKLGEFYEEKAAEVETLFLLFGTQDITFNEEFSEIAGVGKEIFSHFGYEFPPQNFGTIGTKDVVIPQPEGEPRNLDPEREQYNSAERVITGWFSDNRIFAEYRDIKQEFIKMIIEVAFNSEKNIKAKYLREINPTNFKFEGDRNITDSHFVVIRNEASKNALLAVAKYFILGKKTFEFDNCDIYIQYIIEYSNSIKEQLKRHYKIKKDDKALMKAYVNLQLKNLINSDMNELKIYNYILNNSEDLDTLLNIDDFLDSMKNFGLSQNINISRSLELGNINRENFRFSMEKYSMLVGSQSFENATDIIIDAVEVLKDIKNIIKNYTNEELCNEIDRRLSNEFNNIIKSFEECNTLNIKKAEFSSETARKIIMYLQKLYTSRFVYNSDIEKFFFTFADNNLTNEKIEELSLIEQDYIFEKTSLINEIIADGYIEFYENIDEVNEQ